MVLTVFLVSFALTALGFTIAWSMDSTQAFHAIINLFLIPLWLLSGALFPLAGASGWIRFLMRINPLTYGVEALRDLLYPGNLTGVSPGLVAGDAGAVLRAHVWPLLHHGEPPHHQARRMMQVPAQYAIYPVIDAVLNGTSAVLLLVGRSLHQTRTHGRAPRRDDHRADFLRPVSDFLSCTITGTWARCIFRDKAGRARFISPF